MSWTEADVREMYRRYREEWRAMDEIGEAYGITKSRVGQLFDQYGFARRTSAEIAEARHQENLQRAQERAEEIRTLYMEHGTLEAVYDLVDLPKRYIREIVADIPNRESYRRRGALPFMAPEAMLAGIRLAAQLRGEPLTAPAYREVARERGLPTYDTIIRQYGVFAEACKAAGVRSNAPKGPYKGRITAEKCIEDVLALVIEMKGERPSYPMYSLWARDNDRVSGASVRLRVEGGWNAAVNKALDRYAKMR